MTEARETLIARLEAANYQIGIPHFVGTPSDEEAGVDDGVCHVALIREQKPGQMSDAFHIGAVGATQDDAIESLLDIVEHFASVVLEKEEP